MKEKNDLRINAGAPSIILIVLVLALSIFAVLSVRASLSELRLAKKTSEAVAGYYEADSQAELVLAQIDKVLKDTSLSECCKQLAVIEGVTNVEAGETGGPVSVSYEIAMGRSSHLSVNLTIKTEEDGGQAYEIQQWKMIHTAETEELDLDDGAGLWDGQIKE